MVDDRKLVKPTWNEACLPPATWTYRWQLKHRDGLVAVLFFFFCFLLTWFYNYLLVEFLVYIHLNEGESSILILILVGGLLRFPPLTRLWETNMFPPDLCNDCDGLYGGVFDFSTIRASKNQLSMCGCDHAWFGGIATVPALQQGDAQIVCFVYIFFF